MHTAILIACRLVGFSAIYVSLFLRESEDGSLQNRLESWLTAVERRRSGALSRSVAILNAIAGRVAAAFDRVFGKRFFSRQSFLVSMCLSVSSMFLFLVLRGFWGVPTIGLVLFLILGFLPAMITDNITLRLWAICVVIFVPLTLGFIFFIVEFAPYPEATHWAFLSLSLPSWLDTGLFVGDYVVVLFGSFVSDALFVAFTRWMLKQSASLDRIYKIVLFILGNFLIGIILTGGYLLILAGNRSFWLPYFTNSVMGLNLLLLNVFNMIDLVASSIFISVLVLVLIHRMIWPILERPLIPLARYGVIKRKNFLFVVGLIFLLGPDKSMSTAEFIWRLVEKFA
jgi:hypothetical protein